MPDVLRVTGCLHLQTSVTIYGLLIFEDGNCKDLLNICEVVKCVHCIVTRKQYLDESCSTFNSRYNRLGAETNQRTRGPGVQFPAPTRRPTGCEAYQLVPVPVVLSLAVKWLARKVNHSSPFSVEVKSEWSCTATLSLRLHGVHRVNFTVNMFW